MTASRVTMLLGVLLLVTAPAYAGDMHHPSGRAGEPGGLREHV
jgi:hypothetical protein